MVNHPSVGTWVERRARSAPDRIALIFGDTSLTYAALATRVRRLARGLRAKGVQRGDRIVWLGAQHPAFLETFFASAAIGAAVSPINPRLEPDVVRELCDRVAPRLTLQADGEYERLMADQPDTPIDVAIAPDDLCLLPFTSGTTGRPKGVMLTHANLTWNALNWVSALDVRSDDVTLALAPFFRTGGTGANVLPVLFQGGTVVIPETTEPHHVLQLIGQHRVSIGFGSPDTLERFSRSPLWNDADLTSLRVFVTGGTTVPEWLLQDLRQRGVPAVAGYGLSEAAPFVSALDTANAIAKPFSVGRPALFVDARVAGASGGERAAGEIGELLVRGPNVMAGYWRDADATRRAIDEQGWLRTGDAATIDADGFLTIIGRMEDAYMSDRVLVHPGLAERVLLRHPAVAEACVLGDEEGAVAFVVLKRGGAAAGEETLLAFCRDQLDARARPRAIRLVESLPKSANGKILRHQLRDPRMIA